ncbi:MAG: hypothetical protein OEZ39_18805 [Gammaproteobacteria bacterium]|nr:hypothetical protein [Gammaproteobacteria bacterium]MDH5653915.1 hypothetical protein [Gammaproteobacteria bacterium]
MSVSSTVHSTLHTASLRLAFAHLNLRFNPFGELPRHQRLLTAVVELDDLPRQLHIAGTAIQFVADHGRGKSTHLIALHRCFPDSPYTQIHHRDKPRFLSTNIQFVDSIENLSRFARNRLYKRSGSIALTTHRDLSMELTRAGYRVISREIAQLSTDRISAILNARIRHARRNDALPIPVISNATVKSLQDACGSNIREMEYRLYDIFQDLREISDV